MRTAVELVKRCFPEGCGTQVIYVTGFIEYCTSVYRTEHVYFLTKPVSQSDLDDALDRAVVRLQAVGGRSIEVRFGGTTSLVRARCHRVRRKRQAQDAHPCGTGQLGDVWDALFLFRAASRFVLLLSQEFSREYGSHRGVRANEVVLASGAVVPVSQKRRRLLREAFHAHLRSRL